jgi:hypothetical protein
MAYTINLTNGTIFATIADGTINTQSSMILVGKNYAGYGEFLDENFIHLLENGANAVAPGAPLTGQLWWDTANGVMKVYNGTAFKVISASTASATTPTSNVAGDLWFDTVNQQLKVYNGTSFILVGPSSTSGQGTSGAIVTTITDSTSNDHVVVQFFVNNTIVGMVSKDPTFTPQTAISGFSTIGPGIQLSSTVANALFRGTVTNAQTLDGFNPADFLSAIANDTTSGTLGILNDTGLTVGADQDFRVNVTTANSTVNIQNQTLDANLIISVNDGGVQTPVMIVDGATSQVTFPTTISVSGNVSFGNVAVGSVSATGNITAGNLNVSTGTVGLGNIVNNNANGIGNIGSSTSYFNQVFATATTALYADVAERFAADDVYSPGTVVELGGSAEITKSSTELSDNVFGVISTRAAFLMNGGAGQDETHPPIAMTGRVPVRVVGQVRKGDRLVSAGNGIARAAQIGEATAFNVIGRALEDKMFLDEGMIESIVTIK